MPIKKITYADSLRDGNWEGALALMQKRQSWYAKPPPVLILVHHLEFLTDKCRITYFDTSISKVCHYTDTYKAWVERLTKVEAENEV